MTSAPADRAVLMTLEESLAYARPLLRWSDAELREVAARVLGVVTLWGARWNTGAGCADGLRAAADVGASHAEDEAGALSGAAWQCCGDASPQGPWWTADADPAAAFCQASFGPASPAAGAHGASVAAEAGRLGWTAWLAAIDAPCRIDAEEALPAQESIDAALRRWSGAVLVTLPWFGTRVHLLVVADGVRRLLRAPRPVHGRRASGASVALRTPLAAVGASPLRLRAQLDSFELDLGSLLSLRVGDVLHTQHALDRPAALSIADAAADAPPLCHAWLGRRGDALAVELIRSSANPSR
jgi:hypothetical protein